MHVRFVLIGEGSTEKGLIDHLQRLCIAVGATEASGSMPPFERLRKSVGHDLQRRLAVLHELAPSANLIFVHRDADGPDHTGREIEIAAAVANAQVPHPHIALIPVQETEAWLLLDERAIRRVAGRPNGRQPLSLPSAHQIEQTRRPKERLAAALLAAGQPLEGKRLAQFKGDFDRQRQQLLENLPIGGPLEQLASWVRLRDQTAAAIARLEGR